MLGARIAFCFPIWRARATMFADALAYFYDTGPFGLATLCALGATTFAGHLDTKWQLVQACADSTVTTRSGTFLFWQ